MVNQKERFPVKNLIAINRKLVNSKWLNGKS